jgi:probable rRNA maturation factor
LAIRFFSETDIFIVRNKRIKSAWVKNTIFYYKMVPGQISYIFCSDPQILEINKSFLKHFYLTDVITFNYNEKNVINGDIYISVDRVKENSGNLNVSFESELSRVMIHGVLHLLGFNDKSKREEEKMRELEDLHLKELGF